METDHPCRRAEDNHSVVRVTGRTSRQLAVQVIGGVLLAATVGAMSAWGAQQVIGERLISLTHQVQQLRGEVQEMRRDLYQPRYRPSGFWAHGVGSPRTGAPPLPPGRP